MHGMGDHTGKHQGQSGGKGSEGDTNKSLHCSFYGKEQVRQGEQA